MSPVYNLGIGFEQESFEENPERHSRPRCKQLHDVATVMKKMGREGTRRGRAHTEVLDMLTIPYGDTPYGGRSVLGGGNTNVENVLASDFL